MKTYAYIRVSTKEQHIDRQLTALEPFDIPEENIFCDRQSMKRQTSSAYAHPHFTATFKNTKKKNVPKGRHFETDKSDIKIGVFH